MKEQGLGFPQAINAVYPQTEIQTCIVHQIRNSLKYVASKDQKAFMKDLKPVYQAETLELAELRLKELDEKWGKKYEKVLESWRRNWSKLTSYFRYDAAVRRRIYFRYGVAKTDLSGPKEHQPEIDYASEQLGYNCSETCYLVS